MRTAVILTSLLLIVSSYVHTLNSECLCPIGQACFNKICVPLSQNQSLTSMHWLTSPPKTICQNLTIIQGIAVCEDNLAPDCLIWSSITTSRCDDYGSLEFEKYWSQRCKVVIFHFTISFKGNICSRSPGKFRDFPQITLIRGEIGGSTFKQKKKHPGLYNCYNCLFHFFKQQRMNRQVDVLKIQRRERNIADEFDGVQFTVFADIYFNMPEVMTKFNQIVFTVSINVVTLVDSIGREREHNWNMWATHHLLASSSFAAVHSSTEAGPKKLQPLQFSHLLTQAEVDPSISYYHHTFVRIRNSSHINQIFSSSPPWSPVALSPASFLRGHLPAYCRIPPPQRSLTYLNEDRNEILRRGGGEGEEGGGEAEEMQQWIERELLVRCHPERPWLGCDRNRTHAPLLPCEQQLMDALAEDYAAVNGWCDYLHVAATIEPLLKVDPRAEAAFNNPKLSPSSSSSSSSSPSSTTTINMDKYSSDTGPTSHVRLAFFFTAYTDAPFVIRLLQRLMGPQHYYLVHVDAAASATIDAFDLELRHLVATTFPSHNNIFFVREVPIVYGTSTASLLLTRAMAWFLSRASGWDYFVPLTGSDYPLVPLGRIERILAQQRPPMPFIMAWTAGTSTHVFRLGKTHTVFEENAALRASIEEVVEERGKPMGKYSSEARAAHFGPPLFCNGASGFYRLDNRHNKSGQPLDTQWLFTRDRFPRRGRAYTGTVLAETLPGTPRDGQWRVWKKSDPATTGVYDYETVKYIIESEEGKKYFHFFKHMLLGSEEHYYVSLLYNWPRTHRFIQTLSAQSVWNTWRKGTYEQQSKGFNTHTHFLTMGEWETLRGLALRGVFFARKFGSDRNADLLDLIDSYIHFNASTDAGDYWPGHFPTDMDTPGRQWVAALERNRSRTAGRGSKG